MSFHHFEHDAKDWLKLIDDEYQRVKRFSWGSNGTSIYNRIPGHTTERPVAIFDGFGADFCTMAQVFYPKIKSLIDKYAKENELYKDALNTQRAMLEVITDEYKDALNTQRAMLEVIIDEIESNLVEDAKGHLLELLDLCGRARDGF